MPTFDDKPKFAVGEWVVLPIAGTRWDAQVVEDMGPLGVGGERIYQVLVPQEEGADAILRDAAESRLVPVGAQHAA